MSAAEKLNSVLQVKLVVLKGANAGQSFFLDKTEFSIGRGPENEVILLNDAQISRQHAKIRIENFEVEIINLSQKNLVLVGQDRIQKWKLVNESIFTIGETEIQIFYDFGLQKPISSKPVVQVVKPSQTKVPSPKKQLPSQSPIHQTKNFPQSVPQQSLQQSLQQPYQHYGQSLNGPAVLNGPIPPKRSAKLKFYAVLGLVLIGFYFWITQPVKKNSVQKIKSTLRYEDEFLIKQNSTSQKEIEKRLKEQEKKMNSPTQLRINENFQKGMRDFRLGNYALALNFFQLVLNQDKDHALARRHFFLAKIRFDEIVEEKLRLGESYYQKHNFKMCESMYKQVLDMLAGKNNDKVVQLSQAMSEKCRLAQDGIR